MGDAIKDTMERLKKEGVRPISRWRFFLKKILIWGLVLLVSMLSAISLAVIFFLIFQFDWNIPRMRGEIFFFGFRVLPYFWIMLAGLLIFGVYEAVRHTKNGYRYNLTMIILITLGLSFGIATLAHFGGIGKRADVTARRNIPAYGNIVRDMSDQWSNPENGFLAGEIYSSNPSQIEIEDLEGENWKINIDDQTLIMPRAVIGNGEGVKIIGEKSGDNEFEASEIRPWMGNMMQEEFDRDEFKGRKHSRKKERELRYEESNDNEEHLDDDNDDYSENENENVEKKED